MTPKPWYKSRTIWVSLATALLGVLALPEVHAIEPAVWAPYLLALAGAVGVVMRIVTTQPVSLGSGTGDAAPEP